ncbi:hypothetical protein GOB93_14325 [Acetobacter musti]|uniref:YbaB/EbfC family nucleoid-associated protein n=1 Tax=Acetobacter musti TaxID=864732 RepID=A0ABX0JWD6_9PROT|nr:hypothetical protein [Acetobacter musti]NHN85809.1 hypothetical protein [Acetobacter musti]
MASAGILERMQAQIDALASEVAILRQEVRGRSPCQIKASDATPTLLMWKNGYDFPERGLAEIKKIALEALERAKDAQGKK